MQPHRANDGYSKSGDERGGKRGGAAAVKLSRAQRKTLRAMAARGGEVNSWTGQRGIILVSLPPLVRAGLVERVDPCDNCDANARGRSVSELLPCARPLDGQDDGARCHDRHRLTAAGRDVAAQLERDAGPVPAPAPPTLSRAQHTTLVTIINRGGEINGWPAQPLIYRHSLPVLVRLGLLERVDPCAACHAAWTDDDAPDVPCQRPLTNQEGGGECYHRHRITRAGLVAAGTRAARALIAQLDQGDGQDGQDGGGVQLPAATAFTQGQRVTVDIHGTGDTFPGTVRHIATHHPTATDGGTDGGRSHVFVVETADGRTLRCAAWQLTAATPSPAPAGAGDTRRDAGRATIPPA